MDRLFDRRRENDSALSEEMELLRQKVSTLQEIIQRSEAELQEEKQKHLALQEKTALWKEKVKQSTMNDRRRIAELEEKLVLLKTVHVGADAISEGGAQAAGKAVEQLSEGHIPSQQIGMHELQKAKETILQREAELRECQQSLNMLRDKHVEMQQRFSEELEALTEHHRAELQKIKEPSSDLERTAVLEQLVDEQKLKLQSLQDLTRQQNLQNEQLKGKIDDLQITNDALEKKWKSTMQAIETMQNESRVAERDKGGEKENKSINKFNGNEESVKTYKTEQSPFDSGVTLEELRAANSALEERLAEASRSLEALRGENEQLRAGADGARVEAAETASRLRAELEEAGRALQSAEGERVAALEELRAANSALEERLAEASRSLEALRGENEQLRAGADGARVEAAETVSRLRAELEEAGRALQSAEGERVAALEELRAANSALEERLAEASRSLEALRGENEQLRAGADGARVEAAETVSRLRAELEEAGRALQSAEGERVAALEELRAANSALEERLAEASRSLEALRGENEQLRAGADGARVEAAETVSRLRAELEEAGRALQSAEGERVAALEELRAANSALEERLAEASRSLEALRGENEQLRAGADGARVEAAETVSRLRAELEEAGRALQSAEGERVAALEELRAANSALEERLAEASRSLEALRGENEQLRAGADGARVEAAETVSRLRAELEEAGRALQSAEGERVAALEELRAANSALEERLAEASRSLEALRGENEQLRAGADGARVEAAETVSRLRAELEEAGRALQSAEGERVAALEELRAANSALEERLAEASRSLEALRGENEQLRAGADGARVEAAETVSRLRAELEEAGRALQSSQSQSSLILEFFLKQTQFVYDEHASFLSCALYEKSSLLLSLESLLKNASQSLCTSKIECDTLFKRNSYLWDSVKVLISFLYTDILDASPIVVEDAVDDYFDMSVVLRDVDKFKTSFADFSNVHGVVVKSRSVACVLSAVGVTLGDLNAAREILLSDLKCCQEELQKSRDRISELESTCCRSLPDTDNDWQLRNAQLEEKCELLREELERQREFIQRNRASHDTSSLVACLDGTTTPSCCLDAGENSDNVPPSRQQAMTESDVRQLRVKLDALERDNMQLKRECEQNCATIAQYNREMELLRAKERVQLSVEYVRNVILQYLCCSREEVRTKMIPAIAAVLDFTPKEKMDVQSANPTCPRFF